MTDTKLSAIGRKGADTRKLLRVAGNRDALRVRVTHLYVQQRLSIRRIAGELGIGYGTVNRLLSEAKVTFRPRGGTRERRSG